VTESEEAAYRSMVVGAFSFRRKQMQRVVRELWDLGAAEAAELLARAGIAPAARPEVLAPGDFARLLRAKRG
jgi:16S rRNA (adenine1518-N6/adenine1519-N6)-dimethyltransferase